MYSASTLAKVNDREVLRRFMDKHPLKKISKPEDVFKSPDYAAVDTDLLEKVAGIKLIDEFFVSLYDGPDSGPAMSKEEMLQKVQRILSENEEESVVSCLTGIGQFQTYVGVFKREKSKGTSRKNSRVDRTE
jgi:hypothetical protein